jgi:primosomal protein N' (replication factor Y)
MHIEVLFPVNAGTFTYSVPEDLKQRVRTGARVIAPIRGSDKVGIVTAMQRGHLLETEKVRKGVKKRVRLKQIADILDDEPLVPGQLLKLIEWTSQYYVSTPGVALKNAVPSAFFTGRKPGRTRIKHDDVEMEESRLVLTSEQQQALSRIGSAVKGVFLLHGVTGSGKTEVYMRTIRALPEDSTAIVLVPEISITAQMIDRFRKNFGDQVVLFHSGTSTGERIRDWMRMRRGEVKVVLGVRSAVFAPFERLGLIIVDEEQEASYKQQEGLRYNARDVALVRAKLEGLKVILGSATPSLESYHNAMEGRFQYVRLGSRVDSRPMPDVEILDMAKERKRTAAFSEKLLRVLKGNYSKGRQSLIMLNRRGYSPYLMCSDCGYTPKCPACSITLTYHKDTKRLKCHYCGSYLYPFRECPRCKGAKILYSGLGTQRVEEDIHELIPLVSLGRMDRDSTRKKLAHYRIVREMETGKLDVLLGTQMVAKGHDLPDVTVSAIISADVALNIPDFRSAERAFQLFTQLAGRAGRGEHPGKVLIQTFEPDHYVFQYVKGHDYRGFFEREVSLRRDLSYPPFSKLIRIILHFRTKKMAAGVMKEIAALIGRRKGAGIEILGPSPAPIEKMRNLWRWHLILKGKEMKTLRRRALKIQEMINSFDGVKTCLDVDPLNML